MMTSSNANISPLLALCAGNSPVTGEFPSQSSVTWSFDVFFDLRLNQRLSKQSLGWWIEAQSRSLWRHCNVCTRFCWALFCSSHVVSRWLTQGVYLSVSWMLVITYLWRNFIWKNGPANIYINTTLFLFRVTTSIYGVAVVVLRVIFGLVLLSIFFASGYISIHYHV